MEDEVALGQLILTSFEFAPANTVECMGQLLPISIYTELFDLLGTTFGGDGESTFGLPNLPPVQVSKGPPLRWVIGVYGIWAQAPAVQLLGSVAPMVGPPTEGSSAAEQMLPCDGRLLSCADNIGLFSILGTQFGGDGQSTFALPNLPPLRDRNGVKLPYYITVAGLFPSTTYGSTYPTSCDAVTPGNPENPNPDYMLGTIIQVPYLPATTRTLCGAALCRGQLINYANDGAWGKLAALLGPVYGGNGTTTFALPEIVPPLVPSNIAYVMITNGVYPTPDNTAGPTR